MPEGAVSATGGRESVRSSNNGAECDKSDEWHLHMGKRGDPDNLSKGFMEKLSLYIASPLASTILYRNSSCAQFQKQHRSLSGKVQLRIYSSWMFLECRSRMLCQFHARP